jgi:hypothetical protein
VSGWSASNRLCRRRGGVRLRPVCGAPRLQELNLGGRLPIACNGDFNSVSKRAVWLLVGGLVLVWVTMNEVSNYRVRAWQQQQAEEDAARRARQADAEQRQLHLQRCLSLAERAHERELEKSCRERSLGPGCFTPPWIKRDFDSAWAEARGVCQGHHGPAEASDALSALRP